MLHHVLDVLDHDDRIVDDDTDGQHERQQRYGVGGETEHEQDGEGADQRYGHRDDRDQVARKLPRNR